MLQGSNVQSDRDRLRAKLMLADSAEADGVA